MQMQEMNSKVNGVFVPMIKSCVSFFMTSLILAVKTGCVEGKMGEGGGGTSIIHKLEQLS